MKDIIIIIGGFYILYGILGLLGIQMIPTNFKGYSWTKMYKRKAGIGWLMFGIPLVIIGYFNTVKEPLIIFLISIPSFIYGLWLDKYYNNKIKDKNLTDSEN